MTSDKPLAIIALAALILGVALALYGTFLFSTPLSFEPTSRGSDNPIGYVFGTSEKLIQENTDFRIFLENLECKQGTVKARIALNIVCQELEKTNLFYNETSMFFLLQVPYKISNVTVDYYARTPEFYGGSVDFKFFNESNVSLVIVEIPRKNGNFTFGESRNFAFYFEMENVFSQTSYYTYELDATFTNYFDRSIRRDDSLYNIVTATTTTVFRMLRDAELYIAQPDMNYTLTQIMPNPHGIHYYSNNRQYSWDLKAISTSFGSDSVVLDFEHIGRRDEVGTRENTMLFLLGLGIPLAISSFFELWREKDGLSQIGVFASFKSALHRDSLNMDNKKTANVYKKQFYAVWAVIVTTVIIIYFFVPSSVFQNGIDNAFSLVNGLTTSVSILVAFGGAINALMFHEMTKDNPKRKSDYFEALGFYIVPLVEAWASYVALATGFVDFAVKLSLVGFLTALAVIIAFFLMIAGRLKMDEEKANAEKKP